MLILILIDVQYLPNLVFSYIWKRLKCSKSLLVRFPPLNKKIPPAKFPIHLLREFFCLPLNTIWKTQMMGRIYTFFQNLKISC